MNELFYQKIIVLVTTYNRPDALALVLDGYAAQTDQGFSLIIADDGSTATTAELIKKYQSNVQFSITHVWQEDRGFRAAAARNRALATLRPDLQYYVIFTDGDCIPLPDFIAQQRKLAEPNFFVTGNRILLTEKFTREVLEKNIQIHTWNIARFVFSWVRRKINRLLPLIQLGDGAWRKSQPQRWQGAKTCNLAVWWSDLFRINGFDESYSGWGLEDSDLVIRLLHAGVQHKNGRFATTVLHLWHPENERGQLQENQFRLQELLATNRSIALQGLKN